MFDNVAEILSKQLRVEVEKITPDSQIKEDLGADSLDIMQLLMTIEDRYGVMVPDEELATFVTVKDVVNYIESLEK